MKKYYFLIIVALILGLVLTGCSLLSNVGQVPATEQSGIVYLTRAFPLANLVGLWHFDDDAFDSSGTIPSNDGTVFEATYVDSPMGKALDFDGVNDYVEVDDSASLRITGELTIEAWVNENERKTQTKIVSRRSGTYFYFLGVDNGKPYGGIGNGSTYTVTDKSVTMPLNEWHHLAFVYNDAENKMYLYYDSVLKETVAVAQSLPAPTGVKLSIGADHQGTAVFFNGLIDEVRIWNIALTAEQLGQFYDFDGLLSPYAEPPKAFKRGRSIPLKWKYTDLAGKVVDSSLAIPRVRIVPLGDAPPMVTEIPIWEEDPGESGLRYDSTDDMWIFNWQTKECSDTKYEIYITSFQTGQTNGPFEIWLK